MDTLDENCRDFGRYEISGVEEVGFEGGGTILRLDMAKHSMLLPLERAITEGLARSLLNRKYTTEDRCKYIGIDCDKVDLSARPFKYDAIAYDSCFARIRSPDLTPSQPARKCSLF